MSYSNLLVTEPDQSLRGKGACSGPCEGSFTTAGVDPQCSCGVLLASAGDQQYDPDRRDPHQEAQHAAGGGAISQEGVSRPPDRPPAQTAGRGQRPQLLPLRELLAVARWRQRRQEVTADAV